MPLSFVDRLARLLLFGGAVVGFGPAVASAVDLSVRWEDWAGGEVWLQEPCTSFQCGLELMEAVPPGEAVKLGSFGDGSVFRGEAPNEGDGWWVVLDGTDRLPVAVLWRSPALQGHLPPAPVLEPGRCVVEVRDGDGSPLADAFVVPAPRYAPSQRSAADSRPTVLDGWRPWLPRQRTLANGRASVPVPVSGPVGMLVGLSGYESSATSCADGRSVRVALMRREPKPLQIRSESGEPLARVLARDRNGFPVGWSDGTGWIKLSTERFEDVSGPGADATWFETESGGVFRTVERLEDVITVREVTSARSGVIRERPFTRDIPDSLPDRPATVFYWRQSELPWGEVDP